MNIILSERTTRFFVSRNPNRIGINGKPSRIMEIMYQPAPDIAPRCFGHTWDIRDSHPMAADINGKWTFNRDEVCSANYWWPAVYLHDSLQMLLNHLEDTFVEGVSANVPEGAYIPAKNSLDIAK